MSNELARPIPTTRRVIREIQEGKGTVYTLALAGAIPRLSGEPRAKAREAPIPTTHAHDGRHAREQLKDDDPEIRRAAALACAMKDDKSHVADFDSAFGDREPLVGRAAHAPSRA